MRLGRKSNNAKQIPRPPKQEDLQQHVLLKTRNMSNYEKLQALLMGHPTDEPIEASEIKLPNEESAKHSLKQHGYIFGYAANTN